MIKLVSLTIKDLDAVLSIEQQVHSHPWSKEALASAFMHNHLLGLYSQQTLLGFAIMLNSLDILELLDFAIAPLYQRQGYGAQLLQAVIEFAQQKKISRIVLEVRESNHPARALYQQYGFIELHRRYGYYPSEQGQEDAIVMELKV